MIVNTDDKRHECILSFKKGIRAHTYQAIAGFISLEKNGVISLRIKYDNHICLPMENVFCCRIDNKNVFYDVEDGTESLLPDFKEYLHKENNLLFKRAYEEKQYKDDVLIRPYGLNYNKKTYCFLDKPANSLAKKGVLPPRFLWSLLSNINDWDLMDNNHCRSNDILFCTRLWSSLKTHSPVEELNEKRIRTIIALRRAFHGRIIAGVVDSPLSRKMCKDLILPSSITNRKKYLDLIKSSNVCITTTGVHGSIGWKFGEFVASGKAIVSEPLIFMVPGDFREGHNYLSFSSTEELLEKCNYLLSDPGKRREMERNNIDYYFHYLKPDVLIWNTIRQAIDHCRVMECSSPRNSNLLS